MSKYKLVFIFQNKEKNEKKKEKYFQKLLNS